MRIIYGNINAGTFPPKFLFKRPCIVSGYVDVHVGVAYKTHMQAYQILIPSEIYQKRLPKEVP
jgi:hypothetical protein